MRLGSKAISAGLIFVGFVASFCLLTGCGGSLEDIALNALYPYESVNRTPVPENPPEGYEQATLPIKHSQGDFQVHLWARENKARPGSRILIHFHGNGENLGTLGQGGFLKKMETLDMHLVVPDYPAYGRSTGKPNQDTIVTSMNEVMNWAVNRFPGSELVIWGWSLGAGVGAQMAKDPRVARFALSSPWTNTRELGRVRFGGLVDQVPAEFWNLHLFDSIAAASQIRSQGLIHHGTKDTLIPFAMGETLSKAFGQGQVAFVPVPEKGHGDIFQVQSLWDELKSFLNP
jgi:uncharacterized protein